MRIYGNYSGAHTHFNFFAPMVVSQVRVQFRPGGGDRTLGTVEVASDSSDDNQRLATMLSFYLHRTPPLGLVGSWARHDLDAHPAARGGQLPVESPDSP